MTMLEFTSKQRSAVHELKKALEQCEQAGLKLHGFSDGIYLARPENLSQVSRYPHLPSDSFVQLMPENRVLLATSECWEGAVSS